MKKKTWITIFVVSCIFVFAGAVNAGVTRYFFVIPAMALILFISKHILKSSLLFYISIIFIILSIFISHTQTKNPFLFPIVEDGYILILKDGYKETFSDGSGGFTEKAEPSIESLGGEEGTTYIKISKGDRYRVNDVYLRYPDFGRHIVFSTEIGRFSEYDYDEEFYKEVYNSSPGIQLNKSARAQWADILSLLIIAWPVFIVFVPILFFVKKLHETY